MILKQIDVIRAFQEVQAEFPFPGYMDNKLNKYLIIISQIVKEHPLESTILSIGSGPCDLEAILSRLGYKVTAIDDLKDYWHLIGKNRERIKDFARHMNIELIIQPAGLPQLKENHYHAVLLNSIIEHLHKSPRELLNYSISSLQLGGLLLIETPNAVSLGKRLKVLFGKTNHVRSEFFYWNIGEYRSHVREYTRSELKQIMLYHGLTAVNSKMIGIMINPLKDESFFKETIFRIYKLISGLYPNFRDTVLISGRKPKNWHPTDTSIKTFAKYYYHIERYNLDNEPEELVSNKLL